MNAKIGWDLAGRQWIQERERARADIRKIEKGLIVASDIDGKMVETARFHAQRAGVLNAIRFLERPVIDFNGGEGVLVTNPPYGQRIADVNCARAIYKDMSRSIRPLLDRLDLGVITPDGEFERLFGRRSSKKRRIFNGNIQCNYYMYT